MCMTKTIAHHNEKINLCLRTTPFGLTSVLAVSRLWLDAGGSNLLRCISTDVLFAVSL